MNISFAFLMFAFLQVSAISYGQKVSLNVENASVNEVFYKLSKQTSYTFIADTELIKKMKPIDLKVNNITLSEALNRCFGKEGVDVIFNEADKIIVIKQKEYKQQTLTISGRIIDKGNNPMPGVLVIAVNSKTSTISAADGRYKINVANETETLVFSMVGYVSQEIRLQGKGAVIDVSLNEQINDLNEIVVVGYGTVRKSDLTGSVSQVKAKDLNAFPSANISQALAGRAPGVQVLQNTGAPGAPISIRIRGTNSIRGNNEPLYVVDGFPVQSNPTLLNNSDIESIEVLKDASATAIYGNRGANGVVIITTKRGIAGKTKVELNSSYGVQSLIKELKLMNATEYAQFYNEQAANDKLSPYFTQDQLDGLGEGYDWQDLVFTSAPTKTLSLNINGGNEKTQFSLSGSSFMQDGIVKGSNYNRYSLRANVNHEVSKLFSVNLSSTLTNLATDRKDSGKGSRGNSMISAAISAPPTLNAYNEDGSYNVLATAYPFIATDLLNPLNFINENNTRTRANLVLANAAMIFKPIQDLTIKISGGIENRDDRTDSYTTRNFINSEGVASVGTNQDMSLLSENTISYFKQINQKHNLSAVAGFTYQNFNGTGLGGSGRGYLSDAFETYDLAAATTPGIPGSSYAKSAMISYLGRVNYSYNDKYLATLSYRRDGSSKYSEGNKWGDFPSVAFAWKVSNESFLSHNKVISDLKVRSSWGITGSQAIAAYATLNQLSSGKTVFDDALYNTFAPGSTMPDRLKWETTEQKDFGIDLGLFKNKLAITADYYIKNTRDLLNVVRLPSSLGYISTIQNIGEIENKGFELGIDYKVLTGTFVWDLNANISFNRNKVVKLHNGEDILGGNLNAVVINDATNILREGRPLGQFWGYMEEGYTDLGKIKFKDINGDGIISVLDKTYIGDPNPDYILGLNSSMSYRNFDLTLFVQGVQGNDMFNASAITNTIDYGFGLNMPKEVYTNHWTPLHTDAKYPLISNNTGTRVSDRFIERGSYLRLKNIQLGYNIPVAKLKINWMESMQVYVSGQNLFTITDYSWWDPEVNSNGGSNSTAQGYDYNTYPNFKSFTFGIRAKF